MNNMSDIGAEMHGVGGFHHSGIVAYYLLLFYMYLFMADFDEPSDVLLEDSYG